MKKFSKVITIALICLAISSMVSLAGCSNPEPEKHVHQYIETDIASTCTTKGYTEHKCNCGDTYKSNEKELLSHTGRYKCTLCQTDFGKKFASLIQEKGTDGMFIFEASNYGMLIQTDYDFDIIMNFVSSVGTSEYVSTLAYNALDQKWTWVLEWGKAQAYGSFKSLSSTSSIVPYAYSDFGDVTGMMKDIFSTMVYNANQKLNLYNAGFTMENLGLNF